MALYRDNDSSLDLQPYYDAPAQGQSGSTAPLSSPTPNIPMSSRLGSNPVALGSSTALNASADTQYADAPRPHFGDRRQPNDSWMETSTSSRSRRTRYFVIGALTVAILAAVGIALGVTLSKKSHSSAASSSSSSGSGSSVVNETNGDPSNFEKDPALKQSFYGLAYTPEGSQLPECGNTLAGVITDIQLISQLTTRIRLYGADCNQTELVLEAIKQTKVNVSVVVANYPIATDGGAAYTRQAIELENAIQIYGTDHIIGMTVGNEFILDYLGDNGGGDDPNSATANVGAQMLVGFIDDTKKMLSNMSVSLPVGNSDAGAYFNNLVLEDVDYGLANVHPWFANVSIDQAAAWTWEFFTGTDVVLADSLTNKPTMSIAETGWPTNSTDAGNETNGPSNATEGNLQIFLDTFLCQANANGTEYYFFEVFDEPWKGEQFGGVEGYWGLFYANKTLKGVTIPDCS